MSAWHSRAMMSVSMLVGTIALSPLPPSSVCSLQKGRGMLSRKKLPDSDLLLKLRLTSTREELNHLHILLIWHQWTVALVAAIIKEVYMTFPLPTIVAEAPTRALLFSQHLQSSTFPPPLASKLPTLGWKPNCICLSFTAKLTCLCLCCVALGVGYLHPSSLPPPPSHLFSSPPCCLSVSWLVTSLNLL